MPLNEGTLLSLAEAVADGSEIDWDHAESSAAGVEERAVVQRLRSLATMRAAANATTAWGPLQIRGEVGAGTFGTVYRAWDARLEREVALKLLHARSAKGHVASSLVKEGRLLAQIRHPNVVTVHGADVFDGRVGIWMEFVNGRTLKEIVQQHGPFGAHEAALIGRDLCRALAAVHKLGFVHRDIKAQNVMREAGGRTVLMDFGAGDPTNQSDVVLKGSPVYLAPELLRGEPPSVATDLYSVGVLLFYLVTGTFPVLGSSLNEIQQRHAAGTRTALNDVRADLPPAFVDVVERALAPEREQRYASAGMLQAALANALHPTTDLPDRLPRTRLIFGGLLLALVVAVATALAVMRAPAPATAPLVLALSPPVDLRFTEGARNVPTISPDGYRIAFVATDKAGVTRLWLRGLGETAATPVAGSEGASGAFWAPDSQSLAFFAGTGLHRVSVTGSRSESLVQLWENRGGTWGPNNVLLIAEGAHSGLSRLSASGGSLTSVTRVEAARGEHAHMWPQFLPNGQFIYFVLSDQERVRGVYLGSLDGSSRRLLATDASAVYADGAIFYVRDSTLFAQDFDVTRGELSGSPVSVASLVGVTYNLRSAITVSNTGTVLYAPRSRDFRRLIWYDLNGRELSMVAEPEKYRNPALSKDGRFLAVEWYDTLSSVRVFDLVRGGWTSLNAGFREQLPVFGPDHRLALSMSPRGYENIYSLDLDSQAAPLALTDVSRDLQPSDWSPNGEVVLANVNGDHGNYDVWKVPGTPGKAEVLFGDPQHEVQGRFSPDGKAVAYASTKTGRMEIYVRLPWSSGDARTVSTAGGYDPVWRTNEALLYLDRGGWLYEVDVPRSGAAAGVPKRLFKTGVDTPGASRNHYVLSPDGTRILIVSSSPDPGEFTVVLNWRTLARSHQ
jgi:eukaryotic-like serine/threonine-protein kinase